MKGTIDWWNFCLEPQLLNEFFSFLLDYKWSIFGPFDHFKIRTQQFLRFCSENQEKKLPFASAVCCCGENMDRRNHNWRTRKFVWILRENMSCSQFSLKLVFTIINTMISTNLLANWEGRFSSFLSCKICHKRIFIKNLHKALEEFPNYLCIHINPIFESLWLFLINFFWFWKFEKLYFKFWWICPKENFSFSLFCFSSRSFFSQRGRPKKFNSYIEY